jgi:4-amino-4-deoxy-L-arabinose transferase-like glycosyltransferase
MHKTSSRILIIILVIALFLRLALLIATLPDVSRAITPDTNSYMDYARAITEGDFWAYPSALRTPIYPLFLALFQMQIIPAMLGQIAVSLVTIYLTYSLAARIFKDQKIALLAGVLLAFSLESITHTYYLLTETLFTLLFVASVAALMRSRNQHALRWVTVSAVLMAAAILTRPIALVYPVVMAVLLLCESAPWRVRLQKAALFSGVTLLILGIWVVRNRTVIQLPTISTISADSMLYYNAASLVANQTGQNERDVRQDLGMQVDSLLNTRGLLDTAANRSRLTSELGKQIILSDPVSYAYVHLKSDLNSLLPDTDLLEILGITSGQKGTLDFIKQHGLWAGIVYYFDGAYGLIFLLVPFILLLCLVYIGFLVGTARLLWQRKFFPLAVLALPILYGILFPGSASNPRFRVPVMPFMVIIAAYGLVYLDQIWRVRRAGQSVTEVK